MQTIEGFPQQNPDPLVVKTMAQRTMAQRAENLADVVSYIEKNYTDAAFARIELSRYSGEEIQLLRAGEIVRSLGPVEIKAHSDKHIAVQTKFLGVRVFTLCESFAP